jgi:DNA-binding NarL/FixJ family response regulator/c-di-GMP-binding flagellar brake protein YcgR
MKTIVIIENETVQLNALVNLFNQWQKKINIITATKEQAAISIISKQQVDLVVCDLALPASFSLADFSLLTRTFPQVPCIALSEQQGPQPEQLIEYGASHCLLKPFDSDYLLDCAHEILEGSLTGTTEGIPVHSFLQMLESEEQTCTLEVTTQKDRGLLYIKNGELIGAETKSIRGEEAAHLILAWPETRLRLRHFNGQYQRQITKDLLSIIIESFELSSELAQKRAGVVTGRHQLPLQHATTRGKEFPVQIGARIKIVFFDLEKEVECNLVGLVKDNSVIVENPIPEIDLQQQIHGRRVMVKYVYKGRMWMFKSQLIGVTKKPAPLLFLEYPEAIHFHELRKAKRSSIFIPSTFHLEGEKELFGVLIDMSLTGSLCQIKHNNQQNVPVIDIDSTVVLRCLLPGISEEQMLYGKVKNMKIEQGETRIGVEFESLQPQLTNTIGKYLYSLDQATG